MSLSSPSIMGGGTYFDAVVNRDFIPVFNGTREETLKFLVAEKDNADINRWTCVPGETLEQLTVDDYVIRYAEAPK